jgi:hypothetical protein
VADRWYARWALRLAFAWALAGCAAHSPAILEPGTSSTKAPARGPRVVIAPMNLGVGLPASLEHGAPAVEQALVRDLQQRGARVGVLFAPDALVLWNQCARSLPSKPSRDDPMRDVAVAFARELDRAAICDALPLPRLGLRERRISLELLALQPGRRPPLAIEQRLEPSRALPQGDSGPVADGVSLALEPIWRSIAR